MHNTRTHDCGLALLAVVLGLARAVAAGGGDAGEGLAGCGEFGARLGASLASLVYQAGAIDPVTGGELAGERRLRLARQAELDEWFTARGRAVGLADCVSAVDRGNYLEFRRVMATYGFLRTPLRQRRRAIGQIERYAAVLQDHADRALAVVVGTEHDGACAPVRALLGRRMASPVDLRPRFFGQRGTTGIVSLYFPPTATIYLDLNALADDPAGLIDGFEHELWHHLLPMSEAAPASRNLWWEGFTEAISEIWGSVLAGSLPRGDRRQSSVAYPVQTAYATLCLGTDRTGSVAFAGGVLPRAELAERLRACAERREALGNALGDQVAAMLAMPPERQARVETLLHDWRWREDDGSRISIAYLVRGETLDGEKINREFRLNRRFLMDLIQAVTVVNLQDVSERNRRFPALSGIPAHLRSNLRTVLDYVENPYYQLSNR